MTKAQFRKILWLSALVALLMAFIGSYYGYLIGQNSMELHEKLMSDKEFQNRITNSFNSISTIKLVNSSVGAIAILLSVISWVGLFFFWAPARVIFIINLPITYIIAPVTSTLLTMAIQSELPPELTRPPNIPMLEAASQSLIAISALIQGALLIILFSSIGKNLFGNIGAK